MPGRRLAIAPPSRHAYTRAVGEGGSVADRAHPPVDEVAISVAFERQDSLAGPRLGLTLEGILRHYPTIETVLPYEMPIELPMEKQPIPQRTATRLELLDIPPDPRYWLISEDQIELLQLQTDYLGFNWRRRHQEQSYPGHEALRSTFLSRLQDVNASLRSKFSQEIRPSRAELTYVNIIRPNNLWSHHGEVLKIVDLAFQDRRQFDQLAFSYSLPLESESDGFTGRIHVSLQSAFDAARGMPVLNLTITARSAVFDEPTVESVIHFLDSAHEAAKASFFNITTDAAREMWGVS